MKRIEQYRKTDEIKEIDKDIIPFNTQNYAYVSFHCSRITAEQLALVINSFKHKAKWQLDFEDRKYVLQMKKESSEIDHEVVKESILNLSKYIKGNFKISEKDKGWRFYTLPDNPTLKSISGINTEDSFSDILKHMLEYVVSHDGKLRKTKLMTLIAEKYTNKRQINAAFERLKIYRLIEEKKDYIISKNRLKTIVQIIKSASEKYAGKRVMI
jgi:hypothetical protein